MLVTLDRLLAVASLAFAVAAPAALSAQKRTASDSVRAVAEGIIAADNVRDIERVMSFYADDAVLMPPNEGPVAGHRAIRPRYQALFASVQPAIVSVLDEVRVTGEWAFVRGKNTGFMRPLDGGEGRALDDVFVMLLQRLGGGQWKIARLIWHRASAQPR
jgi:uncharacterized protein (TIGR02246 family)